MNGHAHVGRLDSRLLWTLPLVAVGYYLGARLGFALTFHPHPISVMWPPNSILVSALLLTPSRQWWMVFLAALPAHLLVELGSGVPPAMVWCWFISNCSEALIGAAVTRWFVGEKVHFKSLGALGLVFVGAVLLGPFLSSFVDAGFVIANHWGTETFWDIWRTRVTSNTVTAIAIVPVILSAGSVRFSELLTISRSKWIEGIALAVSLLVINSVVFRWLDVRASPAIIPMLLYVPLPILLWAAVRFGVGATAAGILTVTLAAIFGAVNQHGPFAGNSPQESTFSIHTFTMVVSVTLLPLAVALRQKRRTEESLRESEERYREVVESQMDLICRYLPDTTLTFVNEAYCRHFKRTRAQLIGHSFLDLLPESFHEGAKAHLAMLMKKGAAPGIDHEVLLPDGTVGWQHWVDHPILDDDGQIVEFQGIGRDITERKRTEEARQGLAHASRVALLGELTAMIAHEINQPLAAVLSNAEAALMLLELKEAPLEKIREILEDIRTDDLRASQAIRRIREFLGKRAIDLQPLNLNSTVTEVLRLASGDALRHRVQINQNLAAELPLVLGDHLYLQHVLLNLVVNGIDSMNGAVDSQRQLFVGTRRSERDFVEVTVKDTGGGVPADQMARIFESFFTTKPDGMGLGLSIAHSIIETHQGRIWAENNPDGRGATFHFTVPVFQADQFPAETGK